MATKNLDIAGDESIDIILVPVANSKPKKTNERPRRLGNVQKLNTTGRENRYFTTNIAALQ